MFKANLLVHAINTRHKYDLHRPVANFTVHENGMYYSGSDYTTSSNSKLNVYSLTINN
jgi:hypothetical protein